MAKVTALIALHFALASGLWALSTHAHAAPILRISEELPDDGVLDAYHRAEDFRGPERAFIGALYALRSTRIEDLLRTRKALKILLGSDRVDFEVPFSVQALYYQGPDKPEIKEITSAMDWLASHSPKVNTGLQERLTQELLFYSVLVTQLDVAIKYLEDDFLADPVIARQFEEQEIKPVDLPATAPNGLDLSNERLSVYLRVRDEWFRKHGVEKQLQVLRENRELLLNRYHILAEFSESRTLPLYQRIYAAAQEQGFPNPALRMKPVEKRLPQGSDPVLVPTEFDQLVMERYREISPNDTLKLPAELKKAVSAAIDEALLVAAESNTRLLKRYSSEVDYSGKEESPFVELAMDAALWDLAKSRYGYLRSEIDFEAAQKVSRAYIAEIEKRLRNIRIGAHATALGIGVFGIILSDGAASGLLPIATQSATIAAIKVGLGMGLIGSAVGVAASYHEYQRNTKAARAAEDLFRGSTQGGSYVQVQKAWELANADSRSLLLYTMAFGGQFAKSARMLAEIRKVLSTSSASELVTLGNAAPGVMETNNPMTGWISQKFVNLTKNPAVWSPFKAEIAANAGTGLAVEYLKRGERIWDQKAEVAMNMATGLLVTTVMQAILAPEISKLGVISASRPVVTFLDKDLTSLERGMAIWERGWKFGLVGFGANGFSAGMLEATDMMSRPDSKTMEARVKNVLVNAAFGMFIYGTLGNIRNQATKWLVNQENLAFANSVQAWKVKQGLTGLSDEAFAAVLSKDPAFLKTALMHTSSLVGLSLANNTLARWTYIEVAEAFGIQNQPVPANYSGPPGVWVKVEGVDSNNDGRYMDDTRYMFDFL